MKHLNKCLDLATRWQDSGKIYYSQYNRGWNGNSVHVIEYFDHSNNVRRIVLDEYGMYRRKLQAITKEERK